MKSLIQTGTMPEQEQVRRLIRINPLQYIHQHPVETNRIIIFRLMKWLIAGNELRKGDKL